MKRYKFKDKNLSISYPKNWELEEDDGLISIFDPANGVGAVQITSYLNDGENEIDKKEALYEYLHEEYPNLHADEIISRIEVNSNFVYYENTINDEYWEYWLFTSKEFIVFVTYNCEKQDKGLEKNEIINIINAIKI